uniref:phage tail tube protein n=1 Tax=Streptomyces alboviridis TaxID=67269 RepID=UPI000516DF5D
LKDGGEVELDLNYDPREHDSLITDFNDAVPRTYKVVWPGTLGSWTFKAIITGFEPEAPHDDKLAASVTYKVSGKPTIVTGS